MRGNLNSGTTFRLSRLARSNDSGGAFEVDVCSQLTKAFESGMVVDLTKRMMLVPDLDGEPTLFSIGTSGQLHATRRDAKSRSGWLRQDVVPKQALAAANGPVTVDAFAVKWHAEGRAAVLALRPAALNGGAPLLYWTPNLEGDGSDSQWFAVEPPTAQPVHFLELGNGHEDGPELFVASSAKGSLGQMHRMLLSTREKPRVLPFRVPHDWSRVLDCKLGTSDIGDGAYVLYEHGQGTGLAFVSFIDEEGEVPLTRVIPTGTVPACLAVGTEDTGLSSLFIGSDQGVHLLSAQEQGEAANQAWFATQGGPRGTQVMRAGATITHLVTAQDEQGLPALYARTSEKELWHTAHDGKAWNGLTVVRRGVEAIAAARERGPLVQHFFAAAEDARDHGYFWQSESTLWQQDRVTLPDDGTCHETHRYLTRVALRHPDGSPVESRDVRVSAEDGAQLDINGHVRFLRPGEEVSLKTDAKGVLSLSVRVNGVSTPRVTLAIDGTAQKLTLDPTAHVTRKLAQADAATLQGLKDRDGQPLLKGRFASQEGAQHAASLLRTLGQHADALAFRGLATNQQVQPLAEHGIYLTTPGRRHVAPGRLRAMHAQRQALALDLTGGTVRMLHGQEAIDATHRRQAANGPLHFLSDWFGNLIQSIKESFLGKVVWAFIEPFAEGLKVLIETVDGVVNLLVKTAKHALHALDAVMKSVLGFSIEDVVHWLGAVFDPTAIREVYDALEKHTRQTLQQMREGLGKAKGEVDTFFGGLRDKWRELEKLSDEQRGIGLQSMKDKAHQQEREHANSPAATLTRNPVMTWGTSQLLPGDSTDALAIFKPALELMDGVFRTLQRVAEESLVPLGKEWKDTVEHAIGRLKQAAQEGKLTLGYVIDVLGGGLVELVLSGGQAIADALLVVLDELLATMQRVLLETRFAVPLLCPLFEKVLMPGRKFTLGTAFLIGPAVAVSVLGRALTGKTPLVDEPAHALANADEASDNFRLHFGFWGAGVAGFILTGLTDLSNVIRSRYSVLADPAQLPTTLEAGMQLFELLGRTLTALFAFPLNTYFAPPSEGPPLERIGNWLMWGFSVADLLFDAAVVSFKALTGRKEISAVITGVKVVLQLVVNTVGLFGLLIYRAAIGGHPYLMGSLAAENAIALLGQVLIDFGTELPVEPGSAEEIAAQTANKAGLITIGGVVLGGSRFFTGIRLLVCGAIYVSDFEEYKRTFYWTYW
ncbi:hypothetical protein D187_009803 [Cystobacter fuscus DSM 2262]|uniref:Uncharacterized protein n=1 Tax=Cystobacter fuscus (strain ATCC 25194 / DSM 2262 / NBRC 100088 / M29) TaxID=1242864 RepID=S9Q868_CYSF2|nr:hypothetical protein [Cystobacter fuscus]EPX57529.1 hypothetical protein D187_009803 [Cystobacter fuscus DSM 2262]